MKRFVRNTILFLFIISLPELKAQDSLRVTPSNPTAGALSIYEIGFVTKDSLHSDAQLSVTFPPSFDLSKLRIANSTSINGGFTVTVQGQKVILKRTGLGAIIKPAQNVDIKFATIRNPVQLDASFLLKVEFQNGPGEQRRGIPRTEELMLTFKPGVGSLKK